jgi:ATP-binding cassette subfamily B protein
VSDFRFEEEEFSAKFNGGTLLRILAQVKPHWRWVAGFLSLITVVSVLEAYMTYINKRMIDEGIVAGNRDALISLAVQYALMVLVISAAVFGFIFLAGVLGHRVQYDLRKKIFAHLQVLSFSYFDRTPVGWIMSRVVSDSERIAGLVTWGMLDITWAIINLITAFTFMATINWQLSAMLFLMIPLLLYVSMWFKQRILVEYRKSRKLNSKITATFNENITGVRVVKALGREQGNLDEFGELTSDMYKASYSASWYSALFLPVVQIISALAVGVIIWYAGGKVEIAGMTIGGLQAFISYITFIMWPIQDMARVYADMQHAIASAERSFSLLDTKPEVKDRPGAMTTETIRGDIEFEHVDFYYEEDKPVLKNFSLKVKQGETIALVGPTGAGKSTILNLLCRFYEPRKGIIRIGGRDYTELSLHAIQSKLGIVLQTPHLFSGTIKENLRYGRLEATDDDMMTAAKLVGAHDFIITLEKGYDEQVGEGGVLLSVGQKQLISLARAVLAQPEIFIMDEATSSVDTLTEHLIQQGMEVMMKQCTSFVIAHRLSTIKRADRIIVISDGQIEEMGSHAELLRKGGHYYRLYTKQFRDEREAEHDPFAMPEGATA